MNAETIRRARERAMSGRARAPITAVVGRPCAGKTTYVAERIGLDDVVLDLDALARALGSSEQWDHSPLHVDAARVARDAVISWWREGSSGRLWLIATTAEQARIVGGRSIEIEVVDTATDVCLDRAERQGRTATVFDLIRSWTPDDAA